MNACYPAEIFQKLYCLENFAYRRVYIVWKMCNLIYWIVQIHWKKYVCWMYKIGHIENYVHWMYKLCTLNVQNWVNSLKILYVKYRKICILNIFHFIKCIQLYIFLQKCEHCIYIIRNIFVKNCIGWMHKIVYMVWKMYTLSVENCIHPLKNVYFECIELCPLCENVYFNLQNHVHFVRNCIHLI